MKFVHAARAIKLKVLRKGLLVLRAEAREISADRELVQPQTAGSYSL